MGLHKFRVAFCNSNAIAFRGNAAVCLKNFKNLLCLNVIVLGML